MQEVVSMTRRIIGDLRPVTLDTLGLAATLQDHVDRWSRKTGVDVRLTVPSSMPELDPQIALAVFRIVQESLTNIAKHAYASVVNIEVKERGGRIEAVIEDNGVGINRKAPRRVGTHGLLGMRERAAGCGGTFVVDVASTGRGTRIELCIPRSSWNLRGILVRVLSLDHQGSTIKSNPHPRERGNVCAVHGARSP